MTTARALIVDAEAPGFYHCISRCVRRAFLCGEDSYTGRSFEHRKSWIEERLLALADIFCNPCVCPCSHEQSCACGDVS